MRYGHCIAVEVKEVKEVGEMKEVKGEEENEGSEGRRDEGGGVPVEGEEGDVERAARDE